MTEVIYWNGVPKRGGTPPLSPVFPTQKGFQRESSVFPLVSAAGGKNRDPVSRRHVRREISLSYPRCTRGNTVFQGILGSWQRYPRCRATARLPRLPCQPPNLLLKNSSGPAGKIKTVLARKRTKVGWRPPRTMTPPALILAAGRRIAFCTPRVS